MDPATAFDPVTDDGVAPDLSAPRFALVAAASPPHSAPAAWPGRPNDPVMLRLLKEACDRCGASLGAVTLLIDGEERVVARVGDDPGPDIGLDALCSHTVREPDALVVDDLARDPRFCDEPYVAGPPFVRLYAGVPLFDATGLPLGSLCVADLRPRPFESRGLHALQRLAWAASAVLEARGLLGPRADSSRLDALLLTLLDLRVRDAEPYGG